MSLEMMGIVALCCLVLIVFLFSILKDREINKKFLLFERAIEDLNQKIFQLSKIVEQQESRDIKPDFKDFEKQINIKIKNEIENSLSSTIESLEYVQKAMKDFQNEQIERIDRLESRAKEINFIPPNSSKSNEKVVIAEYQAGKSEEQIAKDLRMGVGEVELILKLANLK